MWLGWDRCGYDTFDDQSFDPENNSTAWQPPPLGREEKGHPLSPVGLPHDVLRRASGTAVPQQHRCPQQQRRPRFVRHSSIDEHTEGVGGEIHPDDENDGRLSLFPDIFGGGRRHSSSGGSGSGGGGGGGGGISSFFRGGNRGYRNDHINTNSNSNERTRFLSEDSSISNNRNCHNHHHHHALHSSSADSTVPRPGGQRRDGGGAQGRSSLWNALRLGRRTGSFDGELTRAASDEYRGNARSFGLSGGGGPGRGNTGTSNGKIPEMVRAAFFDPDYDTSRQHLVKLFNALDTNGSGTITYEAMRMGLANLGTYSDVNYLLRRAEMDKSKEISLDGFVEIVQDCAEKMLAAKQGVPVSCFCYDYSPEEVDFRWVKTGGPKPQSPFVSLRKLMAERDDQKGDVRWVCVTGSDPSLVIHLANRFGIHPLQVEDCLNPRERLKVDAFRAAAAKPSKSRTEAYSKVSPPSGMTGPASAAATAPTGEPAAIATTATATATATATPTPATTATAADATATTTITTNSSSSSSSSSSTTVPVKRRGEEKEEQTSAQAAGAPAGAPAPAPVGTGPALSPPPDASSDTLIRREHPPSRLEAEGDGTGVNPPPLLKSGGPDEDCAETVPDSTRGATGSSSSNHGGVPGSCSPATNVPLPPPAPAPAPAPALAPAPAPTEEILHVLLGRISLRNPTMGRPSNFEREQVSIFLVGDHTVLFIEPTASGVSDQISNRIYYAGSKLRLNNARYLVYSLMDSIVDDVFPIMQQFQAWLVQLQEQLHSEDAGPSLDIVRAIQQISRDMHMITFYLRPMKVVATQLITDLSGNDADLKRHLEDLRDHLLVLEEQALRMSTWSRSLNKDWVNEQQHRMNQVVYILTMVTSAFMPAQFLTGVFGMNFKFMPELNWRYSYASFWVLVALLAFSSYTVYKRHKWL